MTFEEAWTIASKAESTLTAEEADLLWRTTQTVSGEVVDIGCGPRACLLLAATGPITSAIPIDEFDDESYTKWRDQIIESGHAKNIFIIKKDPEAYYTWELPIGFLLLGRWNTDQLHSWKIHLVTGAAVAVFNFSGSVPEDFKKESKVGSVTILRHHPKATG